MVFSGQVQDAVQEQDADFVAQGVAMLGSLAGGGLERDGEVAGVLPGNLIRGGKAEDVGSFVFAAEGFVEALELGVGGEQDFDFAVETDEGTGAVEEAREAGLAEGRKCFEGTTWRFDGDHRRVRLFYRSAL